MTVSQSAALVLRPVDHDCFHPFGNLVEVGLLGVPVNERTALRHDVYAFDPVEATPGYRLTTSIFDAQARDLARPVGILERHPHSPQLIMPLGGDGHVVIVCMAKADGSPDLSKLTGFRFGAQQGLVYRPGVWHHPIIALNRRTSFLVQSWQNGAETDCEIVAVPQRVIAFEERI